MMKNLKGLFSFTLKHFARQKSTGLYARAARKKLKKDCSGKKHGKKPAAPGRTAGAVNCCAKTVFVL